MGWDGTHSRIIIILTDLQRSGGDHTKSLCEKEKKLLLGMQRNATHAYVDLMLGFRYINMRLGDV